MTNQQINNKHHLPHRQTGAASKGMLLSILLLGSMTLLAWFMLPQGYNTDLSLIGKGKPAIVLIYDNETVLSSDLMEGFNNVRGTYEDQVEFLLVDLNAPGGREFANANRMDSAGALFFSGEGKLLGIVNGLHKDEALHNAIRKTFNLP